MEVSGRKMGQNKSEQRKSEALRLKHPSVVLKKIMEGRLRLAFDSIKSKIASPGPSNDRKQLLSSRRRSEGSNLLSESKRRSLLLVTDGNRQYTQQDVLAIRRENEELKTMALSEETRETLLKVQRFDRYAYNIESEKTLKGPIYNELRRLEKMKNQHQEMRCKFYDNELTVTCIYNHVKFFSQMNRQMGEISFLKAKIAELEKKMSDMSMHHRKQIAEYKKKVMFLDLGNSRSRKAVSSPVLALEEAYSERSSNTSRENQQLKSQSAEILKHRENQVKLQNKIEELTKQISNNKKKQKDLDKMLITLSELENNNAKVKQENQILKAEIQGLLSKNQKSFELTPRALLSQSKSSLADQDKLNSKELSNFIQIYESIKEKKRQKISYEEQLNELKVTYTQSPLLELLQSQLLLQQKHQTALINMKEVINLFSQDKWRRGKRINLDQQGEIFDCINQIISIFSNLSKEKQLFSKNQTELDVLRKKLLSLSEQNAELKLSLKQFHLQYSKKISGFRGIGDREATKSQLPKMIENQSSLSELDQANLTIDRLYEKIEKSKEQMLQIRAQNQAKDQDKLSSYKILYQKVKCQRDNLNLLLEEKNQEYEISKQNEEKYEQLKRKDQEKINTLKQNYQQIQIQNKQLAQQLSRINSEKSNVINQKLHFEEEIAQIIAIKDNQHKKLLQQLEYKQKFIHTLQQQLAQLKIKHQESNCIQAKESSELLMAIRKSQQQAHVMKVSMEQRIHRQVNRYEKLNKEFQSINQIFEKQRQTFREKLAQFHHFSEVTSLNLQSEKLQRQQLRQQLQRTSCQLTVCIHNSENQKRESRKYIQELLAEGQAKSIYYAEQKRLLKEEIERARCEQYQINQEKIKRLREEIQGLQTERERLVQIIDSNEAPFNQLIQQHKQLSEEIIVMQEGNKQLLAGLTALQQQKQSLLQALQSSQKQKAYLAGIIRQLQERVIDCQRRIQTTAHDWQAKHQLNQIQQVQINQLLGKVISVQEQISFLQAKNIEQQKKLAISQSQSVRLQQQMLNQKQLHLCSLEAMQSKQGQYCQYLSEKLQQSQAKLKRNSEKELQLLSKLQGALNKVHQFDTQRERLLLLIIQKDNQIQINKQQMEKQFLQYKQQASELQNTINHKNSQIKNLKEDRLQQQISIKQLEKLLQNQSDSEMLCKQNHRLRLIIQQNSQKLTVQNQQNNKLVLQIKHLNFKISLIQSQLQQTHQKYIQSQQKNANIQAKLQQINNFISFQRFKRPQINQNQHPSIQTLILQRQQLKMKEAQIGQLRFLNFNLQVKFSELQKKLTDFQIKEQRFQRDFCLLGQIKIKLKDTENIVMRLEHQKKIAEASKMKEIEQKQQQIRSLNVRINSLQQQLKILNERLSCFKRSERKMLLQILRQLDENCKVDEEEIQVKTLQKISSQITDLIEMNQTLKQKWNELSREEHLLYTSQVQSSVSVSLSHTIDELLAFLVLKDFIYPQDITSMPRGISIDKLIYQLGPFLKDLFIAYSRKTEVEIIKYNNIIRDIKALIEEALATKDVGALKNLISLLKEADDRARSI